MSRRTALLSCGILSSLLYAAMSVFIAMLWEGYSSASGTVSELSAIGAPTRTLWVALGIPYTLMVAAFGAGVWRSADGNSALRIVGALLIVHGLVGLAWPPMHQREVLAAGGATMTDTAHIAFTVLTVLFMTLEIGFGAAALGPAFRLYSIVTVVTLLVFGVLAGREAPRVEANLPTPWIGVWERINIGLSLLWNCVLAIALIRAQPFTGSATTRLRSVATEEISTSTRSPGFRKT